jgi:hypothetical protein
MRLHFGSRSDLIKWCLALLAALLWLLVFSVDSACKGHHLQLEAGIPGMRKSADFRCAGVPPMHVFGGPDPDHRGAHETVDTLIPKKAQSRDEGSYDRVPRCAMVTMDQVG